MEFIVIGLAVAFNCMIIKVKFERERTADGFLDTALLVLITIVFNGTYGALVVGTIASAFISVFLLLQPPKLPALKKNPEVSSFITEFRRRAKEAYEQRI